MPALRIVSMGRMRASQKIELRRQAPGDEQWWSRVSLTALSIAVFGAALTQPALFFGDSPTSSGPAWRMLLSGWRAVPHGYVEWCANPALFLSWAAAFPGRRPRLSLAAACASAALMLMFLFRRILTVPSAGTALTITSHGSGYWLWLGSALLMVVAARGLSRDRPSTKRSP
jgi:hypothetical protein